MDWITLIAGLLGGGGDILGSILQNKRAKEIRAEGQKRFEYGKGGMEALLAERQTAYKNVWKMIYGGVSNFDFSSMSPPGVTMDRGPTRGGTDPNDPRDKEGRSYEYGPRPGGNGGGPRSGYTKTGSKEYKKLQPGGYSRDTSITGS